MKLGVQPESLIDRLALWLGLAPTPLMETHIATTLARTVMAGVELGLFEVLQPVPLTAAETAIRLETDPAATKLLCDALVACGYLTVTAGHYGLTRKSSRWLLKDSKNSVRDKILLQAIEWRWLEHLEEFVTTGRPLDFHTAMTPEGRDLYHRSMRALAGIAGGEIAARTPVPERPTRMLDLGGSHGHYAACLCRAHPTLRAEVLDFPDAVATAAPLLAAEGLGKRVVHVSGDVTTAGLKDADYDLIFMSNLAHHLDRSQNAVLARGAARALKPGGWFVISEPVRPDGGGHGGQLGALLGLYFALQSKSGVNSWSVADMRGWQSDAGLKPRGPIRLRTAPGWVLQAARRPLTSV